MIRISLPRSLARGFSLLGLLATLVLAGVAPLRAQYFALGKGAPPLEPYDPDYSPWPIPPGA